MGPDKGGRYRYRSGSPVTMRAGEGSVAPTSAAMRMVLADLVISAKAAAALLRSTSDVTLAQKRRV